MINFVQQGDRVTLLSSAVVAPNSPAKSGDPVVAGRLAGVAYTDGVSGGNTTFALKGVYNLAVTPVHNGVSVGETVFIDPSTGVLSDDFNDVPFGTALDAASGTSTTTIRVRLFGATPSAAGANS